MVFQGSRSVEALGTIAAAVLTALVVPTWAHAGVVFNQVGVFPMDAPTGGAIATGIFSRGAHPEFVAVPADADRPALVGLRASLGWSGAFKAHTTSAASADQLAVADLNGDGRLDLAMPARSGGVARVMLGQGDGTFAPPVTIVGDGVGGNGSIAIAPLGGSGSALDLAVANDSGLHVLLGHGDGTFAAAAPIAQYAHSQLDAGDYTGDGRADLALTRHRGTGDNAWIDVLPGTNAGTLGAAIQTRTTTALRHPVAIDHNNDGRLDLVALNGAAISVFPGAGDGTFGTPRTIDVGTPPLSVSAGDVDGDAKVDLVTSTELGPPRIWLGTDQLLIAEGTSLIAEGQKALSVVDYNGDNHDDIIGVSRTGVVTVLREGDVGVLTPTIPDFGAREIGAYARQLVTLTNTGGVGFNFTRLELDGDHDFQIDTRTCASAPGGGLSAGVDCGVIVRFTPKAIGLRTATLMVEGSFRGGRHEIPLSGTGIPSAPPPPPPVTPPAKDTTAPTLTIKLPKGRLTALLKQPLKLSATCSEACTLKASAALNAKTAKRLRVSRTLATATGTGKTIRLRLPVKALRVLRKQRKVTLTLTIHATDAAGNTTTRSNQLRLTR